ncbi:MAG TPA: hypoxanthine phosphoribosyltransferase [Anaerolineales bacterium]|nr:hypoxanthine phosphoribosyltransferase [Anaerolineales bacterium]
MRPYTDFLQEILIDETALQNRITELGAEISRDYAGEDLLLICILRGGVLFLTDLMRRITIPHTIDFMAVSSYGAGARESTGHVRINFDLKTDIYNCNVLLVEDIIDSGYTLKTVLEILEIRRPKTLRVCTLLDKTERRKVEVPIHYAGFVIPDKFVFGYGLDIDEYYRNLPFIAAVDPARYQPSE